MSNLISILNANSGLITAIATVVLVIITGVYAWLTHKTVEQSKKQQKASYIEKRLEKFYNPLNDVLNSSDLHFFTHPDAYISGEYDGLYNASTKWHSADDLVKYQHLASAHLESTLNDFLEIVRKENPWETAKGDYLEECINDLKKMVASDVTELKKDLKHLNN
ncbi:hypothetical protein [Methanococcoides sp. AM1]|uniref:hypothetical protein n=1 Tax=Methanococcoides sp. AM1 TaxID=1201011 RepID=UPI00108464D8|nr:hypothetical protein [Methanococcoides sp. AM1]